MNLTDEGRQEHGPAPPRPRRRVLRALAMAMALTLLTTFLALLALVLLPAAWWKSLAESAVSTLSGRTFAIEGSLEVEIGWTTSIRARNLRLDDAPWAGPEPMLTVGELELRVRPTSFLRGPIDVPRLEVRDVELHLRRDEERTNWELDRSGAAEAARPSDRTEVPRFGEIRFRNLAIHFDETGRPTERWRIDEASVVGVGAEDSLRLDVTGESPRGALAVELEGGPLRTLHDPDEPYPLRLEVRSGATIVRLEGTMLEPIALRHIDVALELRGPSLSELYELFGLVLPPTPPYALEGRLRRTGGDRFVFESFEGRVGDSDLRGTVHVDTGGERIALTGALRSTRLDFDDLGGLVGAAPAAGPGETASPEQEAVAAERATREHLLPDVSLPVDRLDAMDLDVSFEADRVEAPSLPLDRVSFHATIAAGRLRFAPIRFDAAGGSLEADVTLDGSRQPVSAKVVASLVHVRLAELFEEIPLAEETGGELTAHGALVGTGTSLREILGGATGSIRLAVARGHVSHLGVELLGLDVFQALGFLVAEDDPIELHCALAALDLEQGRSTEGRLVIDTSDTRVLGHGELDFGEETLDLLLEPEPKDFSALSLRSAIRIEGDFRALHVYPDPLELGPGGKLVRALGFLLTPLAGLVPPFDFGLGEDSPCRALLEEARAEGVPVDEPRKAPPPEPKR